MLKILEYVDNHPYIWGIISFIIAAFLIIIIIQFVKGGKIKLFGIDFNINNDKINPKISDYITTLPSRGQNMGYIRDNIESSKASVDFIFVTGGFMSSVLVESILKKQYDVNFNFYLVNPDSESRNKRTNDTKEIYPVAQKGDGYNHIINACKKYTNGKLFFYDDYPFWHYIQIDNNKIIISYNPLGKVGFETSPIFILENKDPTDRLYTMFTEHIRIIKKYAKEVDISIITLVE